MNENKTIFSDIRQIQSIIEQREAAINHAGIMLSLKQKIPYGVQLNLEGQKGNGLINIYYSAKKGISCVDCSKNEISSEAISILKNEIIKASVGAKEKELRAWIGTDESGKGDFFGPLVAAGFFMTREMEKELICLGVADSKTLSSSRIHAIAQELRRNYKEHYVIVAPSNLKYNELYAKINNLNRFLAWIHARVIDNLVQQIQTHKNIKVDGIVTDQFGKEELVKNALSAMAELNIIQRPKGESNLAVAAASIIARDCFEFKMRQIEQECKMKIPFGASNTVIDAAKEFVKKYGREELVKVAKLHFKTYQKI